MFRLFAGTKIWQLLACGPLRGDIADVITRANFAVMLSLGLCLETKFIGFGLGLDLELFDLVYNVTKTSSETCTGRMQT